jgi:cell division protein FtsZ
VADGEDRAIEAAKRAISSPLLEGASVNGARGVIINVTGGPDLSLCEVSDASTIVQEAADEDANIIFGAVVDPELTGMVKITVIATGFGPAGYVRPLMSGAQTPIDMAQYARTEVPVAAPAERFLQQKVAVGGRRGIVDLPSMNAGGTPSGSPDLTDVDRDLDMSSAFDVPAFLRRQDGGAEPQRFDERCAGFEPLEPGHFRRLQRAGGPAFR